MKALLVIAITACFFNICAFSATLSPIPVLDKLSHKGWKPWMFEPSEKSFHLLSVKEDLSQAIMIKPTPYWDKEFKPYKWYQNEQGSAYFLENAKVAVYIFDLDKKGIDLELQKRIVTILDEALNFGPQKTSSFSFSLFSSAHASSSCAAPGGNASIDEMSRFSKKINKEVSPITAEATFNMLKRCGGKVIEDIWTDLKTLATEPWKFIYDGAMSLISLVKTVANFREVIPKVWKELQGMSLMQVMDLICPMAVKMVVGVFTGKATLDAAKMFSTLLSELKLIKNLSSKIKNFKIPVTKPPKTQILTIQNGRALEGTVASQVKSLAKMQKGKIYVDGNPLEAHSRYSGVILDDGKMLLTKKTHNLLVKANDKVGTAFEFMTDSKGNVMVALNQSSTFLPSFDGMNKWMKFWVDKQQGFKKLDFPDKLGTGLPFRTAAYKH